MWSLYQWQWVVGGKYSLCVTIAIVVLSLLISTPESSLETFHLPPPSIGSFRVEIASVNHCNVEQSIEIQKGTSLLKWVSLGCVLVWIIASIKLTGRKISEA